MSRPAQHTLRPVGLRALAGCGGCAAKASPEVLEQITAAVADFLPEDDRIVAGLRPGDDAAVYAIDDERVAIASVDVFPPLVDDPVDYGRVAAANALSDLYAMGAEPAFALSVSGFPRTLPVEVVALVNRGAAQVVHDDGAMILGGHSVHCAEPVFGLCVIGFANRADVWRKGGAQPGNVLVLSKAIGTGVLLSEHHPAGVATALASMCTTNRQAAAALKRLDAPPTAVTDITGFGLVGHCREVAEASQVRLHIDAQRVPLLASTLEAAASGARTSADVALGQLAGVRMDEAIEAALRQLLCDPQTSGGLLAAVTPSQAKALACEGFTVIGEVAAGEAAVRCLA